MVQTYKKSLWSHLFFSNQEACCMCCPCVIVRRVLCWHSLWFLIALVSNQGANEVTSSVQSFYHQVQHMIYKMKLLHSSAVIHSRFWTSTIYLCYYFIPLFISAFFSFFLIPFLIIDHTSLSFSTFLSLCLLVISFLCVSHRKMWAER